MRSTTKLINIVANNKYIVTLKFREVSFTLFMRQHKNADEYCDTAAVLLFIKLVAPSCFIADV